MSVMFDWNSTAWLASYLSPYTWDRSFSVDSLDWQAVLAAADRGLVLSNLAFEVSRRGQIIPRDVSDHLELSSALIEVRNRELQSQLLTLIAKLNAEGVVPVIIKGAAELLYDNAPLASRFMLDIDIWIPRTEALVTSRKVLKNAGYVAAGTEEITAGSHHYPSYYLSGALARVELHYKLVSPEFSHYLCDEISEEGLEKKSLDDCSYYVLGDRSALIVSYLQCRWACQDGHVTLMKWIDFVSRCHRANVGKCEDLRDLGMLVSGDQFDLQLLTAFRDVLGFPYSGPADLEFLERWRDSYADFRFRRVRRVLRSFVGNGLDPKKWKNKSLKDVLIALKFRFDSLGNNIRTSKSKEFF